VPPVENILTPMRRALGAKPVALIDTLKRQETVALAGYVLGGALGVLIALVRARWSARVELALAGALAILLLALMPDTLPFAPIIPVTLGWTFGWAALHFARATSALNRARQAAQCRDYDLAERLVLEAERMLAPLEPQDLLSPATELGALVLDAKASLLRVRMRLDEAAAMYRAAESLFALAARRDRIVETSAKAAAVLREAGRLDESVERYQHALAVIEGSEGVGCAFPADEAELRRGTILLDMVPALIEAGDLVRAVDTSHHLVDLARTRSPAHLPQARALQERAVAAALG